MGDANLVRLLLNLLSKKSPPFMAEVCHTWMSALSLPFDLVETARRTHKNAVGKTRYP